MTKTDRQALRIPERKRSNWSQAVMRDCDFCSQWALTIKHDEGGCICASCCDSEYTTALMCALAMAIDRVEAAEKRTAELENDEVRQRLANAEHQLHMAELAKHNLKASRKAQFRKRKAAERRVAEMEARTLSVKLPPLNDDLNAILGRPNFTCSHLAELLRKTGQDIPRKSEREQAAVIHWFLGLYLEHGGKWEAVAKADIQGKVAGIALDTGE